MINAKQRAYLKSLAHSMKPLVQLGKDGISDKFIVGLEDMLNIHELVKVSILESCDMKASEAASVLAEKTGSEFVQAIGNRFVIFRRRSVDPTIKFPDEISRKDEKEAKKKLPEPLSKRTRLDSLRDRKKVEHKKPKIRSVAKQKAKRKSK